MRLCRILIKMADAFSHLRGGSENRTAVQEKTARRLCDETGAVSNRLLPTEPICCPDGRTGRLRKIGEDSDSAATLRFSNLASRRACLFIGE
ncbi:MAG: hypothetical protein QOD10_1066 [Mycobacterium sp.]|jgi:hypothetical protein|nr:hypothetical protein [Mycobacterium sp.]